MTFPDEHLNYWGDQFIASGMGAVCRFDAFMEISPQLRKRRIVGAAYSLWIQERIERQVPNAGLRDSVLVDPIHHGKREFRRPWFFRLYRKHHAGE